ncbi:unnamed protein product, partial [Rotaria sordida]
YITNMFKIYQDHVCQASDPNGTEKALFMYEIKKKAEQCHDSPRLIIHETRLKLSSDATINISPCTALRRVIQRIRQEENIPTEPKTFAESVFPPNLQNTITNQKFILSDNSDHHRRLLIFASKEQLGFSNGCESWQCDDTFSE